MALLLVELIMLKFDFSIEKKNYANIGSVIGHNCRLHQTKNQLNKSEWLTDSGRHTIKKWDSVMLKKAKALSVRKDSVFAVELIIGAGNQTDWRDIPTNEHPAGPKKAGNSAKMNMLIAGAKAAILKEFGEDRIVSMEMHTDESKPHIHIIFVPILDGKLNAKNWVGGKYKCASLRERIYDEFNKYLPCEYTKGAPGGDDHDPEMAAGKSRSILKTDTVGILKNTIDKLNQQIQTLFSALKLEQKKALKLKNENNDFTEKVSAKIKDLELKISELTPKPPPLPPQKSVVAKEISGKLISDYIAGQNAGHFKITSKKPQM